MLPAFYDKESQAPFHIEMTESEYLRNKKLGLIKNNQLQTNAGAICVVVVESSPQPTYKAA